MTPILEPVPDTLLFDTYEPCSFDQLRRASWMRNAS